MPDLVPVDHDPFERAAERTRNAVRPPGGRQESPWEQKAEQFTADVMVNTPANTAVDAYRQTRAGNYGAAAKDVGSLALDYAPYGRIAKTAGKLASGMVRTAPKTTALGLGAAGAATAASAGEQPVPQEEEGKKEWWHVSKREPEPVMPEFVPPSLTPDEEKQFKAELPPGFDKLGPRGRMETSNALQSRQGNLDAARTAFLNHKVETAKQAYDARAKSAQLDYAAKQAAADAADLEFRHKNESFLDAHPYISMALPYAGAAVGAMVPRLARGAMAGSNRRTIREAEKAVTGANAAAEAGSSPEAVASRAGALSGLETAKNKGLYNVDPKITSAAGVGNVAASGLASGGLSLEGALFPYQVDQSSNLDPSSPAYQAANRPFGEKFADRGALSVLPTIGASMLGAELPLVRHLGRGAPTTPLVSLDTATKRLQTIAKQEEDAVAATVKAEKAKKAAATRAANKKAKASEEESKSVRRARVPKDAPSLDDITEVKPRLSKVVK